MHDAAIARVWHAVVGTAQATPAERRRAERQARLPVKLGGCGLTAQADIADAACVRQLGAHVAPDAAALPAPLRGRRHHAGAAAGVRRAARGARARARAPPPCGRCLRAVGPEGHLLGLRHRWRGPPPLPPGRPGRPEGAAASLEVWHGRGLSETRSTAILLRDPPLFVAEAPDGPPGGLGARGGALHRSVAGACGHLPQRRPQAQAVPPAHVGAAPLPAAPPGPAAPRGGGGGGRRAAQPQRQAV